MPWTDASGKVWLDQDYGSLPSEEKNKLLAVQAQQRAEQAGGTQGTIGSDLVLSGIPYPASGDTSAAGVSSSAGTVPQAQLDEMRRQLLAVGANPADLTTPEGVLAVWQRTATPSDQAAMTATSDASGGVGFNYQAAQLAAQVANNAAQLAYQNAQLELQKSQYDNLSAYQKEQIAVQQAQLALQRETQRDQTGLTLLGLAAQLRGPRNAFQYLRTLSGTPQGFKDVVSAVAGKYKLPGFGGASGEQPVPASLEGLVNDITGGPNPTTGTAGQYTLPAPNKINAANYAKLLPSQRDVLMSAYEDAGYIPADVQQEFLNSLPRYAGPRIGVVTP